MNYVSLEIVEFAASVMQAVRESHQNPDAPNVLFVCEYGTDAPTRGSTAYHRARTPRRTLSRTPHVSAPAGT